MYQSLLLSWQTFLVQKKLKKLAIETVLYSLQDADLKKFRDGQPMGCIFYGDTG